MTAFSDIQLRNIQGIGLAGFRKDQQELVFVRFGDAQSARRLLAGLAPRVASAWEVGQFNALFSEIRRRTRAEGAVKATWVGLGISALGYRKLGVSLEELPATEGTAAFLAGMAQRSAQIGDMRPTDAPTQWLAEFRPGAGVEAVIVVASDEEDDFDRAVRGVGDLVSGSGCEVAYQERGATLPGPLRGHEHFGFRDGGSQPAIEGYDEPPACGEPAPIQPGEFILGYPDEVGRVVAPGELWIDGSFIVFRRLRQDVLAFKALASTSIPGASPTLTPAQLAARMIGRWPSGAPLELHRDADPGEDHESNAFQYAQAPFSDDDGQKCPRWAHIRKAHPRDETRPDMADPVRRHRMLRRGIPFGPVLPVEATADDGQARGLHFLAFVADLDRQFEFIQRRWLNDPNFPSGQSTPPGQPYDPSPSGVPGDGPDPVVGEYTPGTPCVLRQPSGQHTFPLPGQPVTVSAGEYFFAPSLRAVQRLGEGATSSSAASPGSGAAS